MAPALDLEHRILDHLRAAPAAFGRALGLAAGNVEPGKRLGGCGDRVPGLDRLADQLLEMGFLGRQRVAPGLGDPARLLVQGKRIEPHCPGHGLAMGEAAVGRHQRIGAGGGNLDEIAQHPVVADLQRDDPGLVAVLRLEHGNRPPGIAGYPSELVERVIVTLGDIAALPALGRRRRHQRAGEQVGQRAVPGQPRQQGIEQRRAIGLALQVIMDPPRLAQPVAQLPQVAWTAPPGDDPAQRPADIRQCPQHRAQIAAQQGIAVQPLDQRQPRFDSPGIGQRRGQVFGQLPRPGPGDAAVDRLDQAAAAAALAGNQHLKTGPGRLVHGEVSLPVARDRRQQQRQPSAPGMVEIADQPAGRGQHRPTEQSEPVECSDAMHRLEPRLPAIAGEVPRRSGNRIGRGAFPALGDYNFAGAEPREGRT